MLRVLVRQPPPAGGSASTGQTAIDWFRSSGIAQCMLDDVCKAAETTVEVIVGEDPDRAREVLDEYPRVLACCDELTFDEPAQALAYLTMHLPDRYCRMFQVLERLLASGRLPVGKNGRFAAIDIGAGPGPGILAVRNFHAALARYAALQDASWPTTPVGRSHVVEPGQAMNWVMHQFAKALILAERSYPRSSDGDPPKPNPCAKQLEESAIPFGSRFNDFTALDIWGEHHAARKRIANELYDEDGLDLSRAGANRLSYQGNINRARTPWPS